MSKVLGPLVSKSSGRITPNLPAAQQRQQQNLMRQQQRGPGECCVKSISAVRSAVSFHDTDLLLFFERKVLARMWAQML